MIPADAFPLTTPQFAMRMGTRPLPTDAGLVVVDAARYAAEIAIKRAQLDHDAAEYVQLPDSTRAAQWEAVRLLLADMARVAPGAFRAAPHADGLTLTNLALGEQVLLRHADPAGPLLALARHLQEDLALLDARVADVPLSGGVVAFPADWSLREKVGRSFVHVHEPVPLFGETIATPSVNLLQRMRADRPVWRANWGGLKPNDQLDYTPKYRGMKNALKQQLAEQGRLGELYFRVERQVLAQLPETGHVLFTIHTFLEPLASVCARPDWARNLLGWLDTAPDPWLDYKGVLGIRAALRAYVQARATA